ncbi:MAG TPA: NfeD family protein [Elainellaceae cyanobacterium]
MEFSWTQFLNRLLFGAESDTFVEASFDQYPYSTGEAVVEDMIFIGQTGRVQYDGSSWPARCNYPTIVYPGTRVRVIGRKNITLLIEPIQLCLPAAS